MDQPTVEYYEKRGQEYFNKTNIINVDHFRKKFIKLLYHGIKILDVGCGSGRDLKEFQKYGFLSTGLERSSSLQSLASLHSGCQVVQGNMEKMPFPDESFDAIWCCAVLVHLSEKEIQKAIKEMIRIAKKWSSIFLSLKKGKGYFRSQDTRLFYFYETKDLERILYPFPLGIKVYQESIAPDGTVWLNLFTRIEDKKKKERSKISLSNAISWGNMVLKNAGIEDALMETEWLLEHAIKKNRMELYCNPGGLLNYTEEKRFFSYLQKRSSRCPFAYITKQKDFMEFSFKVGPGVLIPRPETELMVEYTIKKFSKKKPMLALDIGTGSGCIAISLLKYLPHSYLVATDISSKALKFALKNACLLGVCERLLLCQANLFPPFFASPIFDCILSNPPYISNKDYISLMPDVKNFEPPIALLAEDGLFFYRKILSQAFPYLKKEGFLILEIGYGQLDSIRELLNEKWKICDIIQDLSGIDRHLVLKKRF